jgi:hypothetical protein
MIFARTHIGPTKTGQKQKDIVRWLSPVDPWETHEAAVQTHYSGTGDWFLESNEYLEWQGSDKSDLWLSGFRKSS